MCICVCVCMRAYVCACACVCAPCASSQYMYAACSMRTLSRASMLGATVRSTRPAASASLLLAFNTKQRMSLMPSSSCAASAAAASRSKRPAAQNHCTAHSTAHRVQRDRAIPLGSPVCCYVILLCCYNRVRYKTDAAQHAASTAHALFVPRQRECCERR